MSEKYDKIVAEMKQEFSGFEVFEKEKSVLSKVIFYVGFMWLWCPRWMTDFNHTAGHKVWLRKDCIGTDIGYRTLRHERVHMRDARRWPIWFQLSYILLPIGPSGRAYWEFKAYKESMKVMYEEFESLPDGYIDWLCSHFTGSTYLFMWPFKKDIRARFERVREEILHGR